MKKLLLSIFTIIIMQTLVAQQTYCDFEGLKVVSFGEFTGTIDSLFSNPAPDNINSSAYCARHIRDTTAYDNFKLYPDTLLEDVSLYAVNNSVPKITLKLYSTAPAGTTVHVQLGARNDNNYPTGIHSEYTATTTIQNGWENLTFNYLQSPMGSLVLPTQINKVVILFNPNSIGTDTIYFDDLMGPELLVSATGISEAGTLQSTQLYQNSPNPAKENTRIGFQLSTPGFVSLELFDLLGKSIAPLFGQNMKAGIHSIPVETSNIPNGIYFYVLKKEGITVSRKMIVSK